MSFLKSFYGRVFVNKNENLHKSACSRQATTKTSRVVVKQQRRENIYTNEIRLIHYRELHGIILQRKLFFQGDFFDGCGGKKVE